MSIQYIGARYVPKLFESPNGGAAWVPNIAYEALTIVTYANNSYTSRIPVPASVGSPNNNPHYWVSTGVYNAYVETLRQEVADVASDVEEVTSDVNTLEGTVSGLNTTVGNLNADYTAFKKKYYRFNSDARKVLFIGDSYAAGWTPDGTYTGWPTRVSNLLGLYNTVERILGGIGFVNPIDGVTFGNIADDVPNKDTITDIVIAGGRNDANHTIENIKTAIHNAIDHYKQLFPNAVIHIGMICYSGENNVNCWNIYRAYLEATLERGAHYLPETELCISSPDQLASDKKHPNNAGLKHIGECIASGLAYDSYQTIGTATFPANETGCSGEGYCKMSGDTVNLIWTMLSGRALSVTLTEGQIVNFKIGTHSIPFRFTSDYKYIPVTAIIGYKYNNIDYYQTIPAQIKFMRNGDMRLEFKATAHTNTAWLSGTLNYFDVLPGCACSSIWD